MTDLIAELAEVVRQMRAAAEDDDHLLHSWANTVERWRPEIEAMARDAKRYDWLNAHRLDFIARNNMHDPRVYLPVGTDYFQPDAMDNAIDAAMRECITHHHACDCRESEFAAIKAERDALRKRIEEAATGVVEEVGDDETGQPRALIVSTRNELSKGPSLSFKRVALVVMEGGES